MVLVSVSARPGPAPRVTSHRRSPTRRQPVTASGAKPTARARDTRIAAAACEQAAGRRGVIAAMMIAAASCGDSQRSAAAPSPSSVFSGVYDDPNHPGCPRTVDNTGKIEGVDPVPFKRGAGCEKDTQLSPWTIQGKIDEAAGTIFIDFDQKDGSGEAFLGKWTGSGIELPDGTLWTQVSK